MRNLFFILAAALIATGARAESPAIFIVRHAERADAGGPAQADPALSQAGKVRASSLAEALRDARISAIYTTEYKRTQETAAPLAASLGVKSEIIPAKDESGLIAKLKANSGNVLVVGHSNTVPEIIKALGISTPVTLAENDYDDLFLVGLEKPPRLIHLHYR